MAGNLPYNVSSPILIRLLELSATPRRFRDATVMLQKEVADRVLAGPGGRDYGPLAIFVAVAAKPSRLLTLPPGAFRPMPEVTSAVVRLDFSAAPPVRLPSAFGPLVRGIFTHAAEDAGERPGAGCGQPQSDCLAAVLDSAGLDGRRRPETLAVDELVRLAEALDRPN